MRVLLPAAISLPPHPIAYHPLTATDSPDHRDTLRTHSARTPYLRTVGVCEPRTHSGTRTEPPGRRGRSAPSALRSAHALRAHSARAPHALRTRTPRALRTRSARAPYPLRSARALHARPARAPYALRARSGVRTHSVHSVHTPRTLRTRSARAPHALRGAHALRARSARAPYALRAHSGVRTHSVRAPYALRTHYAVRTHSVHAPRALRTRSVRARCALRSAHALRAHSAPAPYALRAHSGVRTHAVRAPCALRTRPVRAPGALRSAHGLRAHAVRTPRTLRTRSVRTPECAHGRGGSTLDTVLAHSRRGRPRRTPPRSESGILAPARPQRAGTRLRVGPKSRGLGGVRSPRGRRERGAQRTGAPAGSHGAPTAQGGSNLQTLFAHPRRGRPRRTPTPFGIRNSRACAAPAGGHAPARGPKIPGPRRGTEPPRAPGARGAAHGRARGCPWARLQHAGLPSAAQASHSSPVFPQQPLPTAAGTSHSSSFPPSSRRRIWVVFLVLGGAHRAYKMFSCPLARPPAAAAPRGRPFRLPTPARNPDASAMRAGVGRRKGRPRGAAAAGGRAGGHEKLL